MRSTFINKNIQKFENVLEDNKYDQVWTNVPIDNIFESHLFVMKMNRLIIIYCFLWVC